MGIKGAGKVDIEKLRAILHPRTGTYFNPNTSPPRWEQMVRYKEADVVVGHQSLDTPWEERQKREKEAYRTFLGIPQNNQMALPSLTSSSE